MFVFLLGLVMAGLPGLPGSPPVPDAPPLGTPNAPPPQLKTVVKVDWPPEEFQACMNKVKDVTELARKQLEEVDVQCPPKDAPQITAETFIRDFPALLEKRRLQKRDINVGDPINQCIPLVSADITANPYHEDLIGTNPNTVLTRPGYGRPFYLDGPIDTHNTEGVTWTITRTKSFSKSVMVGITFNDGTTNTKVNGTNWSSSNTNSIQDSINEALEKSNSTTLSQDSNGSQATDIQKALTKNHEISVSNSTNHNVEQSEADAITWNSQKGTNTNEDTGTDTSKTTGSDTTTGWDRQNEHSNSVENSITESWACTITKGKTVSGSITGEIHYEVSTHADASFDLKPEGMGPGIAAGISTSLGGSVSVQGSLTSETSNSITYTFTMSMSKTSTKAARCGTNGNVVEHDTTTVSGHSNTQHGTTTMDDKGGSNTKTKSRSEGGSQENRQSDSLSDSYTNGWTNTTGWSRGRSDVYGNTMTKGITKTKDVGFTNSTSMDFSVSASVSHEVSNTTQVTDTTTWEVSRSIQLTIPKDSCIRPACAPLIKSTVIPWACMPPNNFDKYGRNEAQIVLTEIQSRSKTDTPGSDGDLFVQECYVRSVTCKEAETYKEESRPVYTPSSWWTYKPDQSITSLTLLALGHNTKIVTSSVDPKANYYFGWGKYNEFGIYTAIQEPAATDKQVWGCGVQLLTSTYAYVTVSDNGHIELYADGVYNNKTIEKPQPSGGTDKPPPLLPNSLVWSSLPRHLNEVVGVYGNRFSNPNFGYKFIINPDTGYGELYDSAYVKIWSTNKNNKNGNRHAYGYKFPIHIPYPSDVNSCNAPPGPDPDELDQKDINNVPPTNVKWLSTPLNYTNLMQENQGIRSADGRFTLHLTNSPNLIIKQGCRTMWETYTGKPWHGTAPYTLVISTSGQIKVKDFLKRVIWTTTLEGEVIRSIQLSNLGVLQGLNMNGTVVWQSRNDDPRIPGGHKAMDTPVVDFDDDAESPALVRDNFPLVNMYNNKCIYITDNGTISTAPVRMNSNFTMDFSQCQIFNLNPVLYTYTLSTARTKCISTTKVETCSARTLWRHYTDGLLVNIDSALCLDGDARSVNCVAHDLRIDKLWSRGVALMSQFGTNTTDIMLHGNMFFQNNVTFRYTLNAANDIVFEAWDYNRRYNVKHHIWNTRVKAKDRTILRILDNGLSANITAIPQYDGRKFQPGVPPYVVKIDPIGMRIKDSLSHTVWNWPF